MASGKFEAFRKTPGFRAFAYIAGVLAIVLFAAGGCRNQLTSVKDDYVNEGGSRKTGTVLFHLGNAGAKQRTVFPEVGPTNFDKYCLVLTKGPQEVVTEFEKDDVSSGDVDFSLELEEGDWIATAEAFIAGNVVAEGTAEQPITVTAGTPTAVTIKLKPLLDGQGVFKWEITSAHAVGDDVATWNSVDYINKDKVKTTAETFVKNGTTLNFNWNDYWLDPGPKNKYGGSGVKVNTVGTRGYSFRVPIPTTDEVYLDDYPNWKAGIVSHVIARFRGGWVGFGDYNEIYDVYMEADPPGDVTMEKVLTEHIDYKVTPHTALAGKTFELFVEATNMFNPYDKISTTVTFSIFAGPILTITPITDTEVSVNDSIDFKITAENFSMDGDYTFSLLESEPNPVVTVDRDMPISVDGKLTNDGSNGHGEGTLTLDIPASANVGTYKMTVVFGYSGTPNFSQSDVEFTVKNDVWIDDDGTLYWPDSSGGEYSLIGTSTSLSNDMNPRDLKTGITTPFFNMNDIGEDKYGTVLHPDNGIYIWIKQGGYKKYGPAGIKRNPDGTWEDWNGTTR